MLNLLNSYRFPANPFLTPARVDYAEAGGQIDDTVVPTLAGATAGNKLVLCCCAADRASYSFTVPNGFTSVVRHTRANDFTIEVFQKDAVGGEAALSVETQFPTGNDSFTAQVIELENIELVDSIADTDFGDAPGGNGINMSLTYGQPCILLGFYAIKRHLNIGSFTAGISNVDSVTADEPGSDHSVRYGEAAASSAGTTAISTSSSGFDDRIAVALALKAAEA